MPAHTDAESTALAAIMAELDTLAENVDEHQLDEVATLLSRADRVFVQGAGRSGFALQMTAMRLMHLGLTVFVVGETTTPAIREGDVLLAASGSGTTASVVHAAETALSVSARIAAITTAADSALAHLADVTIVVPAATKLDRSGTASAQYSGSLFEQAVVLIGDAVFHQLWKASGLSADDIWPRHANLE